MLQKDLKTELHQIDFDPLNYGKSLLYVKVSVGGETFSKAELLCLDFCFSSDHQISALIVNVRNALWKPGFLRWV